MIKNKKLDNPIWYSLTETHKDYVVDYAGMKFYQPDYCPFGAFIDLDKTQKSIDEYSALTSNFYVVGDRPLFSNRLTLTQELICHQMIIDKPITFDINEDILELKTEKQKDSLFDLVDLVQPGYFKSKTVDLGKYFGIFKDEKLIAVTGERLKMDAYTEVSAVVTHPSHTRKGYAKQLIAYTCNQIFSEDKQPFLHVAQTNIGPIKLYEKLGFTTRRKISFWHLMSKKNN